MSKLNKVIRVVFFLQLTLLMHNALAQSSLLNEGNIWSYMHTFESGASTIFYRVKGDTSINSNSYKIVQYSYDSLRTWKDKGYYRENGDKFISYSQFSNDEILIWDLGISVGDSSRFFNGHDSTTSTLVRITDSIIGNDTFKFYTFKYKFGQFTSKQFQIIYGIGSTNDFNQLFFIWDQDSDLLCNFDSSLNMIYTSSISNSCYESSSSPESVFENNTLNLSIFPNPFTSKFKLNNNYLKQLYVEIYDIFGKKIEVSCSNTNGTLEVNGSKLKSGVYFIVLISSMGEVISRNKVIKK